MPLLLAPPLDGRGRTRLLRQPSSSLGSGPPSLASTSSCRGRGWPRPEAAVGLGWARLGGGPNVAISLSAGRKAIVAVRAGPGRLARPRVAPHHITHAGQMIIEASRKCRAARGGPAAPCASLFQASLPSLGLWHRPSTVQQSSPKARGAIGAGLPQSKTRLGTKPAAQAKARWPSGVGGCAPGGSRLKRNVECTPRAEMISAQCRGAVLQTRGGRVAAGGDGERA